MYFGLILDSYSSMKKYLCLFSLIVVSLSFAQQTDYVDFKQSDSFLEINMDSTYIKGYVGYVFDVKKPLDSLIFDAKNMTIYEVSVNRKKVDYDYDGRQIIIKTALKSSTDHTLMIHYKAKPEKALYFLKRKGDWNIWTQGQGKYTSNWLPSFDDVNEKVIFNISISAPNDYHVLLNGNHLGSSPDGHNLEWMYAMKKPMSSYLVALAIGKYDVKKEISKSGVPIDLYYYPEDTTKVEPTYRYTKQIFDFLEAEIGFAYPWQNYKQVPVHDFLYAGMENTSLTIFSDAFVVDDIGFNDKNYVNVNAHELAHQWFGNLVTATSGEHHWLQEGFATYYALLAEREIFGDDYYNFKLYQSAQDLGRQDVDGGGTSLLNPKSSSLTFYQRGAWVLHALREKVGDVFFKQAVKNYLEKYQFANVKTDDFIAEVERLAEQNLSEFVDKWIVQEEFPFNEAIELLKQKSTYIQEYIMVDCEAKTSKCKDYLKYDVSDDAKVKVIAQAPVLVDKNTFLSGLKVRQAISQYVTSIPKELKADYESLLNDKSYITIESALYNLWINFPEDRIKYLVKTKDIIGFNDKNVRLLWLVLALNTIEYQPENNDRFYKELLSYTDASQNFELRMKAFDYLALVGLCETDCKNNLKQAIKHHNWRMSKFAKDMLEKVGG
jgi:aminopeptidase N